MKCSKCGRELAPDEKFCGGCGSIVSETTDTQAAALAASDSTSTAEPVASGSTGTSAPADSAYIPQAASGTTNPYMPAGPSGEGFSYTPPRDQDSKPVAPAKKKKVGGFIAIIAAAVVVVALIVAAVFAKESIIRMIKSPEDYTKYVLKKNLIDNKTMTGLYNSARSDKTYNQCTVKYYLNASDEALDDLYSGLKAEDVDVDRDELEFAKEIALTLETGADNGKFKLAADLILGGNQAMTADMIYDTDSSEIYFRSKELNEDYAYYEFSGNQRNYSERAFQQMLSMLTLTNEGLPSEKEMSEIWNKYAGIAIDQIDDVEESRETLTAGDISQKMTVLEIEIDDKLSKAVAVEILGELKDDDDFKDIMKRAAKSYAPVSEVYSFGYYGFDEDDFADELDDWLDDAYKEAKNIKFKDKAVLELYVSNKGVIQGLRFECDDEEFYYLYTQKFGKFGAELRVTEDDDDMLKIVGNGKVTVGKIEGTFDIEIPEEDVEFTVGVEGFNVKQLAKGTVSGTITLDLGQFSKELKELDKEEGTGGWLRKLADYELSLYLSTNGKDAEVKCALSADKKEYLSTGYSVTMGSADSIKVPSGKETVQIKDEDDMIDYLKDCDFDGWADDLEDCGLPEEVTDEIADISKLLQYY